MRGFFLGGLKTKAIVNPRHFSRFRETGKQTRHTDMEDYLSICMGCAIEYMALKSAGGLRMVGKYAYCIVWTKYSDDTDQGNV